MDKEKLVNAVICLFLVLTILGCSSIGIFNLAVIKNLEILPDAQSTNPVSRYPA
jgi:hypothetical protein